MLFWTRLKYCFLLCLSSKGAVWLDPLPNELRFRLVQARLRHVFGLCTGALFFFVGGSKGAVLDPPNVLFFADA